MERRVIIQDWQKVTEEDFNNLGYFPRESFDHLIADLLIPDKCFTGFGVVESGTAQVTVGAGRLYYNGIAYLNDTEGGTSVSLLASLPSATKRYVAICAWGQEIETETEPRTFLTDATTRATVAKSVSTESRRWANISTVVGTEGPDPDEPVVAANVCVVAYVLLSTTGIDAIEVPDENLAPTLREADNRLNAFDAWKTAIGTAIDTLRSDLAGLAAKLFGTARQAFVLEIARDLARTKEALLLPDDYEMWGSDHFLTEDESDTEHVDYLATCEEGVRFPPAGTHSAQLGLLNQYDPNANQQNYFVLPAFSEVARITSLGKDDEVNVSTYAYQTLSLVEKSRQRCRWRYGDIFQVCTNWLFFQNRGTYDAEARIFTFWNGETWYIPPGQNLANHIWIRAQRAWLDCWNEAYWELFSTTSSALGSVIGQTFLNAQDGWMTSLDVYFTRVAAAGSVTVLICDTTNGAPDPTKVIGKSVLAQADMHTYPTLTNIPFTPTFLSAGKRYAVVLVTAANHYVALTQANKYAQGSMFYCTDGAWFMGDLTKDIAFQCNFAKFYSPRVEIQLLPLELTGGIAAVDILAQSFTPPQCTLTWQVQDPTLGWMSLSAMADSGDDENPFIGLPPMLPFRVVLTGTTDSMPGIGVASNSRVITTRPRSDFRHISTIRDADTNVNTVTVDVRLEQWRGAGHHTFVAKLLVGATYETVESYDTIEEHVAPDDPNAWIRRYTFSGLTPAETYRIRLEGTTDNVLACFHVAERVDVATMV